MTELWIGVQDYADTAPKWLDSSVSFSWLRAFERAESSVRRFAFVRELHYTWDMAGPVRGVTYCFRKAQFPDWADQIVAAVR